MTKSGTLLSFTLWTVSFANFCIILWGLYEALPITKSASIDVEQKFSYIGRDYPLYLPINRLEDVALTLHETVHFEYDSSDPTAFAEWYSLVNASKGFGRVRLGPEHRVFILTHYHELHCLRNIQFGLVDPDNPAFSHHVEHCLNYLRMWILCEATDTVEYGDFMKVDYDGKGELSGDTLICSDWEMMYRKLDNLHSEWREWRDRWN